MSYDLSFSNSDGTEYPYSESLGEDGGYHYRIQVHHDGRNGELNVFNEGVHIEFQEGDWLDFVIPAPERLFTKQR